MERAKKHQKRTRNPGTKGWFISIIIYPFHHRDNLAMASTIYAVLSVTTI